MERALWEFLSSDFQVFALPVAWVLSFPSRFPVFFFSVTLAYAVFLPFATRTILTAPALLLSSSSPPCNTPYPSFLLRGFLLSALCFLCPTPSASPPGRKLAVPFPPWILPRGCASLSFSLSTCRTPMALCTIVWCWLLVKALSIDFVLLAIIWLFYVYLFNKHLHST